VLDGNYITTEIVQVVASNVTIADLTCGRPTTTGPRHAVRHRDGTLVHNVRIVDPGQQAIR
jgi:hypothetical protein